MSRFYNKQKEAEKWEGPFCPKIGKKLLKNAEHVNICYVLPAGKGIFQVQERQSSYIVDVISKHCDCRRWDLTGIPCCHAIDCIREERLSEQDFLPFCYSIEAFKSVYANNIMPCSDRANWEKMNGPQVLPPVYEKKVGRPKKTRRKHPTEVQGKNGLKLNKHGVIIHCSYCHEPNHNKKGCPMRKKGIKPKIQIRKKKDVAPGSQEMMGTQPGTSTGLLNEVNDNMLSVIMAESSQPSQITQQQGPLPDSAFIQQNQPSTRPVVLTTATKEGRAKITRQRRRHEVLQRRRQISLSKKKVLLQGRRRGLD
ncbi:uncharacterized protein [Oryza sativa Japonica Group]|uniref:uncharacterized protein n=1 Tax=Oryza sativa subsp. japonica TaxID=39947 RepID=UPI00339BAEFB